jgi:hypothetical protein
MFVKLLLRMRIANHLTVADKATVVKIVVRDERSGANGSVAFRLP